MPEPAAQEAQLPRAGNEAVLVFGHVQDAGVPGVSAKSDAISTGPAMVIGDVPGAAASWAPAAREDEAWSGNAMPDAAPAMRRPAVPRNPMPQLPAETGAMGRNTFAGLLVIAVLVGGGVWWWTQWDVPRSAPEGLPAAAEAAPADTVVPVQMAEPTPIPIPIEQTLLPNEHIEAAEQLDEPSASVPVVEEVVEPAPALPSAPARAAGRKPVHQPTLDELLN